MSDIRLGMSPDPSMHWSKNRANDIKETFSDVIKKCDEEDIELLLISGDLFNHQPLIEELDFVDNLFKTIPSTRVVIIAGANDHIKSNSPILNYRFSENVYYFLDNTEFSFSIGIKECVIHGFSYYSPEEKTPIINSITPENDKNIHILISYGGDMNHSPFDINKLENKNFSYIALGSNNNYKKLIENKCYYPGRLEPLDANDTGDHGIIIGEINEHTGKVRNIKFEKMARVAYIPLSIKINGSNTEDDIINMVTKEIIGLGKENIYTIEISGFKNPDIEFSIEMFNKKIKVLDIIDSSIPKYDFVELAKQHPQDMIGAFIRRMNKDNSKLSDIEKRALYLGTHALLKTSEKDNNQV